MPSSPDATALAVAAWHPQELGPTLRAVESLPAPASTEAVRLFEVSPTSGIPEAVLAPARIAAENAGYVAGWNRGYHAGLDQAAGEARQQRRAAEQQAAAVLADLDQAAETLRAAARSVHNTTLATAADVEDLIVTAAFRIAESLVGVTLADDALRGRAAVVRALALAPRDEPVVVAVSPADHALIAEPLDLGPHVSLVADPTLATGDSYARVGATTIDARISAGLARVRDLLDPA